MKKEITIDFSDLDLYVDWVEELTDAVYDPDIRYIFLKGGAGAGKSYTVAQIIIQNILDGVRIGCFRKVGNTLRPSVFQLLKDIAIERDLNNKFLEIKETHKEIRSIFSNGFLNMFGLDDPEKIKSLANYDRFRVEETTELTYDDFTQLDLRLRGGENHKIICTFNPISSRHWLKLQVHDKQRDNATWIMKTARNNKFVGEAYLKNLESMKEKNLKKYLIYAKNERGESIEGLVYSSYNVFYDDIEPEVIGLDFGWNDPCALTYVKRLDVEGPRKRLMAQQKIYQRELTSQGLVELMLRLNVPKNVLIIADSSRPEMINEIRQAGFMIEGVKKYAGSKIEQIQAVQGYDLWVNGEDAIREVAGYMWKKDRDGQVLDVPVDGDDHFLDSVIYAVTHYGKQADLFFEML